MTDGPALLALQLHDSFLEQIGARRKRLPELVPMQVARSEHDTWRAQRDAQVALIEIAVASIEASEVAGAELDTKQARLEAQLKTIIAPREAEALMHEIDALKAKHSALDDVELAAMEQQAAADDVLATLAAAEPAIAARLADAQATLDAALGALAAEEADVRATREAAHDALSDADRTVYADARRRHGSVGFCTLERHACTGCHVDLSQVEYEQVVAESKVGLAECPHCGRSLVI